MSTDRIPNDKFRAFRDASRYHRNGVIFTEGQNSEEQAVAASLPADQVDWLQWTIASLSEGQAWKQLEPREQLGWLHGLATSPAPFLCRLVLNFDIALSKWDRDEQNVFWSGFGRLARNAPHPVILLLPAKASFLGPQGPERDQLESEERLVVL